MVEESDFERSWETTSQALERFYLRIAASKCQICTKMVLDVWENTDRQGSREGGRQESTARAASPPPLACAWVRESRTVALSAVCLSYPASFRALMPFRPPPMLPATVTSPPSLPRRPRMYVYAHCTSDLFIHMLSSLSHSLSVCLSVFLRAYLRGSLFGRCCWLARLATAAAA